LAEGAPLPPASCHHARAAAVAASHTSESLSVRSVSKREPCASPTSYVRHGAVAKKERNYILLGKKQPPC
jgi:hypothetical protein